MQSIVSLSIDYFFFFLQFMHIGDLVHENLVLFVVYIIARKYKSGVCQINVERNSFLNLIYANKFIRYSVPFMYHYDYRA